MSEDTENQQHLPWNEGLPTKPDVDALLKAFPPESIKPGEWRVTDDEMSEVVRLDSRYRTITDAWRNRLERDHGVRVKRQKASGFYCPTPDEVFADTHPTYEHVGRVIRKQRRHVANVKPENETQRVTQEHQGRLLYASDRALKKDRMNTLPSTEATGRPQISPPVKAAQK